MRVLAAARLLCPHRMSRHGRACTVTCTAVAITLALAGAGAVPTAMAQTVTSTTATTVAPAAVPTTVSPIDIRMTAVLQNGAAASAVPIGGQILQVVVSNSASSPISNQQVVVRVPVPPAVITQVTEQNQPVGVIDPRSGFWYHTIAQLNAGASLTYVVTWFTPCPGRWGLVSRVGDRRTQVSVQLVGTPQPGCPPDEVAQIPTAGFFELPWPPTAQVTPTVTSTTQPALPATLGATSTTSTVGVASVPAVVIPSTTRPATTTTLRKSTTSTVIVCKTVGGRRYCGAQSSIYRPGQKKVVESKPKSTRKTTRKTLKRT